MQEHSLSISCGCMCAIGVVIEKRTLYLVTSPVMSSAHSNSSIGAIVYDV